MPACSTFAHTSSTMATRSEGRPSVDRTRVEPGYSNRALYRQQSYDSNNQQALPPPPPSNSTYNNSIMSRNRYAGVGGGEEQLSNGNLSDSSAGGRHGRDRDRITTQNMPISERSRTNGSTTAKRICDRCGEPLLGQFVRAMGGMFHLECFMCRVSLLAITTWVPLLTEQRTVDRSWRRNFSRSMMKRAAASIHYVRLITFDGWTSFATSAEVLFVGPISRHSTANTTLNISPAQFAQLYSAHKTAITNMQGKCIATITTRHSSRNAARAVKRQSSSNLSRSSATAKTSTGILNAT